MQVGQLFAGVGIGIGLAAGSIGVWQVLQSQQASSPQAGSAQVGQAQVGQAPTAQPVLYSQSSQTSQTSAPAPAATGSTEAESTVVLSQAENDYLYDLSQALQSVEQRRIHNAEKLAIGRQIAGWLAAGADYWDVRSQFDATYRNAIAGDYGHNRDVYIKFATERLAPAFVATLTPPPPAPQVIVQTRTEYVEVPGEPQVIEKVVPDPYPVPVYPRPHWPKPDHPDYPNHPDYPDRPDHPDYPDHDQPPVGENPQPDPDYPKDPPVAENPQPDQPDLDQPDLDQPEQPAQLPNTPTVNLGSESSENAEPVL